MECLKIEGDANKLFEAIGKASAKFQPLPKNKKGQYGNQKFDYAPYHTVRKCILTPLLAEGVSITQPIHSANDNGCAAVSLIVTGHGASITTTLNFVMNPKCQDFGKESTYYRRYQLQSFFCLEGDADADDLEDPVTESKAESVKEEASKRVEPKSVVATQQTNHINGSGDKSVEKAKDTRSVKDALIDAMKQLNWNMTDMDWFCKEHISKFPDYVGPTKLNDIGKATLLALLVEHKQVAPF